MTWDDVVQAVKAKNSPKQVIATVWHPTPSSELIHMDCGSARVLVGEPQYQLSTGEIVKL